MSINLTVHNGLCNRLIPILSTYKIAKSTGKKLNILWDTHPVRSFLAYNDTKICYFTDIFEDLEDITFVNTHEFTKLVEKSDKIYSFHYQYHKKLIINPNNYENITIRLALYPILLNSYINVDNDYIHFTFDLDTSKDGLFDNHIYRQLKPTFKLITPKSHLQTIINQVYSNFNKKMVGIHLRKTDGSFTQFNWEKIDDMLIKNITGWLAKYPNLSIFLATDCETTNNKYKQIFNNRIITYTPDITKFQNNSFNVSCAVVDLFLLAKCNTAIIGTLGSSFSITAGLLSNSPLWLVKNSLSLLPDI
jgi:hypothetical protein